MPLPLLLFIQEKSDKAVLEETAFEEIERDFQEVLGELSGDKSLEKFRIEYEKLHAVMKKSYDNEKRLMAKCRELNAEIVVNSAKVATALKLSQDDQTTIVSLKKVSDLEKDGLELQTSFFHCVGSSRLVVNELLVKKLDDLCIL
jgi:hypothetical protein